jgi:hypothetical protein
MIRHAHNNIRVAREYMYIKILATTVLEALARATGGDAPLSLFMGDVPKEGASIKRLEYFLPELENAPWVDQHSVIYQLLESGRASDVGFDMKNSPLSLFIYKALLQRAGFCPRLFNGTRPAHRPPHCPRQLHHGLYPPSGAAQIRRRCLSS